jgi:hypothetical protein
VVGKGRRGDLQVAEVELLGHGQAVPAQAATETAARTKATRLRRLYARPVARWLIDGMNVIGSRPDRWWRDRDGAKRRLAGALSDFAGERGEVVTVVFDGSPLEPPIEDQGVEVRFAPGGPNAADREIAELVRVDSNPGELRVVTSDGALAEEVRAMGAEVLGAGGFRDRQLDG